MAEQSKEGMELQIIQQHLQQVQQQVQAIEESLQELDEAKESIETLSKEKEGTEILVPIVSGIFVRAKLQDASSFIVNAGSHVTAEKNKQQVLELLEKQKKSLQESQHELIENMQKLTQKAQELEAKS